MGGEHRRLPDLPFLLLAVPHDAVDPARAPVEARSVGHAARDRKSLPEGARGDLDAGRVVLARVPLQMPVELAEAEEVGQREIAALRHERVDHRRHVADREMPEVPPGIVKAIRIDAELVEKENGSEVGRRKRPAAVAALRSRQERYDVAPHEESPLAELVQAEIQPWQRFSSFVPAEA